MDWPATVGGYAVRPVEAMVPALGQVTALIVDEEADLVDEDLPEWVPAEWLSPVMGDSGVSDVYGAPRSLFRPVSRACHVVSEGSKGAAIPPKAIGVWPAAFVAAEAAVSKPPLPRARPSGRPPGHDRGPSSGAWSSAVALASRPWWRRAWGPRSTPWTPSSSRWTGPNQPLCDRGRTSYRRPSSDKSGR